VKIAWVTLACCALTACVAPRSSTRTPAAEASTTRRDRLCRAGLGCLAYEIRGAARSKRGLVRNAVLVISAFGFDERIDALWPGLIGPGRPLDPARYQIIGVMGAVDEQGHMPTSSALVQLLDAAYRDLQLARDTPVIGAASYGAELALRALARGVTRGPLLLCGGHDRPWLEPAMRSVREVLAHESTTGSDAARWLAITRAMVGPSYTPGYLADPQQAEAHGLASAAARVGLSEALAVQQAESLATRVSLDALRLRMDGAFAFETQPLVYPALDGQRVILLGNREDRMMTLANLADLARRLRARGADVVVRELSDARGHSVFFGAPPAPFIEALAALLR
jgi:Alpha/beta hydrolase family